MKQRYTSTALLPAPSVDEAQDNSLPDTAPKATVVIPAEANLRVDDLLIVTWEGIAGVGTVVSFPLHIGAGDVGNTYDYAVKRTAIAANTGRTVNVSYEVVRADGTGQESSAVYLLNIGTGTGAEFTLDTSPARIAIGAALTRNASGGVPPYTYTSYNTSVVTVDSPAEGIVRGVGAGSASVLVHDSAEPETSQKGYVITVVSGGAREQGAYGGNSTMKKKNTSKAQLPAPLVEEAEGNALPETAPKATVVVPVEANLRLDDLLIVTWEGVAGAGTVVSFPLHIGAGDVGRVYTYSIKKAAIEANIGHVVNVSYEVVRADGTGREPSAVYLLSIGAEAGSDFLIDTSPATIAVGATLTRNASGGTPPYTYTSDNTAIVTVANPGKGVVRGVAAGKTSVFVHDSAVPAAFDDYAITVIMGAIEQSTVDFENTDLGDIPAEGITVGNMAIRLIGTYGGRIDNDNDNPPFLISRMLVLDAFPSMRMDLLREAEHVTFAFAANFFEGQTGTFTTFDGAGKVIASHTPATSGLLWIDLSAANGRKIKRIEYAANTNNGAAFDNFTFTY